MPRYFFHLWNGAGYVHDDHGSELDQAEAAYLEAYETAQALAIDLIRDRQNAAIHRFDVVDEDGRLLFELPFTEVVGTRATPHPLATLARRPR